MKYGPLKLLLFNSLIQCEVSVRICFVVVIRCQQTNKQKETFITCEYRIFNTIQLRTRTVIVFHNIISLPVLALKEILSPPFFMTSLRYKRYYQRYFVETTVKCCFSVQNMYKTYFPIDV